MFDSNISVKDFIEEIKNEADIAPDISNKEYVFYLNTLEQLLYSEIIKEQAKVEKEATEDNEIDLYSFNLPGQDKMRFEDIHTVFADKTQLIKTTYTSGMIFDDCYFKISDKLGYSVKNVPSLITIIYFVRPALKEVDEDDNILEGKVMLPYEFLSLAKAYIRGEAYKVANENELAAKWINEYNVLTETFKIWISEKQSQFGM